MSAQLGCIQPTSPLKQNNDSSVGSDTNTLNRIESSVQVQVQDSSTLFKTNHFIRGKTFSFLLPSSSFRLFQTPPYDCYGPGWGMMIEESICQELEKQVQEKIVKFHYPHKKPFSKTFGWLEKYTNRPAKKQVRTFYQCQLDKEWSQDEQKQFFEDIKTNPIKACFVSIITWPEEDSWRFKLVNLHLFTTEKASEEFFYTKFLSPGTRRDTDSYWDSKKWTTIGGEL